VSALEVPAELIERAAKLLENAASLRHSDYCSGHIGEGRDCPLAAGENAAVAALRALLPQPVATCPNCGHDDGEHWPDGCLAAELACDCAINVSGLPQVRALLAAERDSKPAGREPRVWLDGDPEPEVGTVVRDRDRDEWTNTGQGVWTSPETRDMPWERIARKYSPLTEVLPGGAR
jgi:hypothetical protein